MKRSLLILLMVFGLAAGKAGASTAKAAGTVTAIVGTPRYSVGGGKFEKLKVGMTISVGTVLRTGSGKVSILLSDGSVARLGGNTEITLKAHNPEAKGGGTVFRLAKGFARFLVAKLKTGRHFELETPNAVAAVKGTYWEGGVDEKGKTTVKVFGHDSAGVVELSDLGRKLRQLLKENEKGGFDGKDIIKEIFGKEEQEKAEKEFSDMDDGKEDGKGEKEDGGEDSGLEKSGEDAAKAAEEAGRFEKLYAGILDSVKNDLQISAELDAHERMADILERRTFNYEGGGIAVVTNKVSLPLPNMVVKEAWAQVMGGQVAASLGQAGLTYVNETSIFNQALPYEWPKVVQAPLGSAFTDASGYPLYYKLLQSFNIINPSLDQLSVETFYDAPLFDNTREGALTQGLSQAYLINGNPLGFVYWHANEDLPESHGTSTGYSAYNPQEEAWVGDDIWVGINDRYEDGILFEFVYENRDWQNYEGIMEGPWMFTQSIRLMDNWDTSVPFEGFPESLADYRNLASSGLNMEISFRSPLINSGEAPFASFILLPGFYDYFDMVSLPANYHGMPR